jgi:hypothetical protein
VASTAARTKQRSLAKLRPAAANGNGQASPLPPPPPPPPLLRCLARCLGASPQARG